MILHGTMNLCELFMHGVIILCIFDLHGLDVPCIMDLHVATPDQGPQSGHTTSVSNYDYLTSFRGEDCRDPRQGSGPASEDKLPLTTIVHLLNFPLVSVVRISHTLIKHLHWCGSV